MTITADTLSPDEFSRLRSGLIEAVRIGTDASRNNSRKWDTLYQWFHEELQVGDGTSGGRIIGKVVVEYKQVGNRVDEMAKSDPTYAIINCLNDVTPDKVLRVMRRRASLPSLRGILFLQDGQPSSLVEFDA